MDKLFGITDVVMIGDQLSTLLAEARANTDMRLRVKFGTSDDGTPSERHTVVVNAGHGHWQHFDIGERDFKFLRWTGIDVEVVAGPKGIESLGANRADAPRRTSNGYPSSTGQPLTAE